MLTRGFFGVLIEDSWCFDWRIASKPTVQIQTNQIIADGVTQSAASNVGATGAFLMKFLLSIKVN